LSFTASEISFIDSCFEASRNPQVLMTITSARAGSAVIANPSWASSPSIRSLSTKFFGHPKLTNATVRIGDDCGFFLPRPNAIKPAPD
jgi:hypothetical protein